MPAEVDAFFAMLAGHCRTFRSDGTRAPAKTPAQVRQDKLFTFIRHDGVPWNNNNAENAIKRFAQYRQTTPSGMMKEGGLADYLVLLSIYMTCRFKGVSFLKFLLTGSGPRRVRAKSKGASRPTHRILSEGFQFSLGWRSWRQNQGGRHELAPEDLTWRGHRNITRSTRQELPECPFLRLY